MVSARDRVIYGCDAWEVDLGRQELRARGASVPIGGRAFEIIGALVRSAGALVTKDELMGRVWPGAIIEENTLQVHISAVRKALGPDRGMLKTVSGRGYRLLGAWAIRQDDRPEPAPDLAAPAPADHAFTSNLPFAESALIGRTASVQQLRDLVSAYRVVTLTGPGGIGKTRLALEVARQLPDLQGEACLVELASLSDPNLVTSAAAHVLGLQLGGDEISPDSIARAIGGRRLLLVLDNCEHVIDAAAKLAEAIVRACPRTFLLITSREILRIDGEYTYRVPPLDVPPPTLLDPADALEHSAVQLFVSRVKALSSGFALRDADLPAVAAICRRLDGMPLAIEFAASRAATLGLEEVLGRLDDRFALLTGGRRTALPRHQTLRATLDWSYELLPEAERRLLCRLAVFTAGFTLEAATCVMSEPGDPEFDVVDGIANLVAKSLVVLDGAAVVTRWRLLETVRAYALDKLAASGETELGARRHAEYFRDLFAPAGPIAASRPTIARLPLYRREIDNVRAALDWAFSPAGDPEVGVVLTAAYVPVWLHLSLMIECRERAERALDNLRPDSSLSPRLRIQLLTILGMALVYTTGAVARTEAIVTNALELADRLGDADAQLEALYAIWIYRFNNGEHQAAEFLAERFAEVARRTGDISDALLADRLLGSTSHYGGSQSEAQHSYERLLERYTAPSDQRYAMWIHYDGRVLPRARLARILWLRGLAEQADRVAQACLADAQAADHKLSICYALGEAVCPLQLSAGDIAGAERSVATLMDVATRHSFTFWTRFARCLEGKLLIKRGEIAKGSAALRVALEAFDRAGQALHWTGFVGDLAEGLAGVGQGADALAFIDDALARSERDGVRWHLAELLRVKGELLLLEGADPALPAVEDNFFGALEVARRQSALTWELRVALSLARLRGRQGRADEARPILAPVYARFTEGFETADLRAARALLDSLPVI
jgi:predicted ATPase/DNA-binding winged helix-turn-helix (wHTH) protein